MKLVHRDFEKDGAGRLILIPEEAEVGTLIENSRLFISGIYWL